MTPVSELFEIFYGHSLELNRLTHLSREDGGIAFVSRKMGDNGISAYVAPIPGISPSPAGILTCALSGGVMSTFLQEEPFYSGYHIALLYPKTNITRQELLFYSLCLLSNRYRFSYGRQANRTLKNILIPSLDEIPAYVSETNVSRYDGCNRPANNAQPSSLSANE